MKLEDLVVHTASAALDLQGPDGDFEPGHNGPYHDPETPVRNTAHWSIALVKAFEITNDERYLNAARQAAEYLLRSEHRPMGASYLCRTNPLKDLCNGLIGQAWVIEALVTAGRALGDVRLTEAANELFQLHPFDEQRCLWRRVNVDGSIGTVDNTFNHQLWFAATAAMIDPDHESDIGETVAQFLEGVLGGSLRLHRTGRVRQAVGKHRPLTRARNVMRRILSPRVSSHQNRTQADKETGYHSFNLYGFAMLYRWSPEHPLWSSPEIAKVLQFINRREFESSITSTYGGPYNPVGLEVAYAVETFSELLGLDAGTAGVWIARQLDHTYDPSSGLMTRNTVDPHTLAARFYEATRLENQAIEVGDR
jgi:hypothetical protein